VLDPIAATRGGAGFSLDQVDTQGVAFDVPRDSSQVVILLDRERLALCVREGGWRPDERVRGAE
jgi:hypothetical protein